MTVKRTVETETMYATKNMVLRVQGSTGWLWSAGSEKSAVFIDELIELVEAVQKEPPA